MTPIWVSLIISCGSFWLADRWRNREQLSLRSQGVVRGHSSRARRKSRLYFIFGVLTILVLSAFRANIGDTLAYMLNYHNLGRDINTLLQGKDFGFSLFTYLLKWGVNTHPQTLLIFTSTITVSLIFYTVYKFSPSYFLSGFLFYMSGYFVSIMNGVRQSMVAAVMFSLLPWLLNRRKWWKYLLVVLAMSTFHYSAFLLIPVYFILVSRRWTLTVLLMVAAAVLSTNVGGILSRLVTLLEDTQYGVYVAIDLAGVEGANPLRVAVVAVPLVLSYLLRGRRTKDRRLMVVLTRMSAVSLVFYILGLSHWIFARMAFYFMPAQLILLPMLVLEAVPRPNRQQIVGAMLVLYSLFFWFDTMGLTYRSYVLNINFEPGIHMFYDRIYYPTIGEIP